MRVGELVARSRAARPDRLEAWLAVGVELGELGRRGDRYVAAGRRARMLSGRDPLLASHYRSMLEYQLGPYAELADLLGEAPQQGRDDLERHARTIAEVSLAAAPFIVPFLRRTVEHSRPERALDVGCGTGVYLRALLGADPRLGVEGIELAPEVASDTAERLRGGRAVPSGSCACGRRTRPCAFVGAGFRPRDVVQQRLLLPRDERVALYRHLGDLLAADGVLLVTTMTWPGSVASAHLHLMLRCQSGSAGLPGSGEVEGDLNAAGFDLLSSEPLVPSEPFVGITARRRTAGKPG